MTEPSPWADDPGDEGDPDLDSFDLGFDNSEPAEKAAEDAVLQELPTERVGDVELTDVLGKMLDEGRRQAAEDGLGGADDPTLSEPVAPARTQDDIVGLDPEMAAALQDPNHPRHEEAVRGMEALDMLRDAMSGVDPNQIAKQDLLDAVRQAGGEAFGVAAPSGASPEFLAHMAELLSKIASEKPGKHEMNILAVGPDGPVEMVMRPITLPKYLWDQVDEQMATHEHCHEQPEALDVEDVPEEDREHVRCQGASLNFQVGRALAFMFADFPTVAAMIVAAEVAEKLENTVLGAYPRIDTPKDSLYCYMQMDQALRDAPPHITRALVSIMTTKYLQFSGRQPVNPDALAGFDPTADILAADLQSAYEIVTKRIREIDPSLEDAEQIFHLDFEPEEDGE